MEEEILSGYSIYHCQCFEFVSFGTENTWVNAVKVVLKLDQISTYHSTIDDSGQKGTLTK
jgi:hypothetical protein